MKHLKQFNEELNPDKYIRAGKRLKDLGKSSRGVKLADYGYQQKYGTFNTHMIQLGSSALFTGEFTNITSRFYYGLPSWNGPQGNRDTVLMDINIDEEDLLTKWEDGSMNLGFTIEFRIHPTENSKVRMRESNLGQVEGPLPLFCMYVRLSDWEDGLREYNWMDEEGTYAEKGDDEYLDLPNMYHNNKVVGIELRPLMTKNWLGIFADRKSAINFKKQLPQLVDQHKSKIMDLLSPLNGSTDDLERIINTINSFSTNYLYQDEIKRNSYNYKDWFYKVYTNYKVY